jgi:hypothetical protein
MFGENNPLADHYALIATAFTRCAKRDTLREAVLW